MRPHDYKIQSRLDKVWSLGVNRSKLTLIKYFIRFAGSGYCHYFPHGLTQYLLCHAELGQVIHHVIRDVTRHVTHSQNK